MNKNFILEIIDGYKFLLPEFCILLCILININTLFFDKNKKSIFSIFSSIFLIFGTFISQYILIDKKNFVDIEFLNGMYSVSKDMFFLKELILISLAFIHIINLYSSEAKNFINKFIIGETSILINISALGAIFAISCRNFMFLYLAFELQSLSSYIFVNLKRSSKTSSEATLKYFVLGVLSSSMMLFGISLVYFSFESVSFFDIYKYIMDHQRIYGESSFSMIGILGIVFIFCGLFFKLSSFPFHSWLPDIYQASSNSIVMFLGIIPKIMSAYIVYYLYHYVFIGPYSFYLEKILATVAFLSLILGAFIAISQKNFKRLIAYSGIANSGFIIIAILGIAEYSMKALNIYFLAYMIGFFGIISFCMFFWDENSDDLEKNSLISTMSGISKKYPIESILLSMCILSIAGIPPFIGFFGKFQIIFSAFSKFNWILIICALASGLISLIYYLNIIKVIYFDEYNKNQIIIDRFYEYRKFLIIFGSLTIFSIMIFIFNIV